MREQKTVIIYGAGDFGKRLFTLLGYCGVKPNYFCQTEVDGEGYKICGLPVISVRELSELPGGKIILIALQDEHASMQVRLELSERFLDKAVVYECGRFIEQNQYSVREERKYCLACASFVNNFGRGGVDAAIFKKHHIIGGGYRENSICPHCHSHDRGRWATYVLAKWTGIFQEECRVLHFAPESGLEKHIRKNRKCDYYPADVNPQKAMHVIDVTDIPYRDEMFDYIILNHVLEHISEEGKAIAELKRVLKPSGKIIMSFPICTDMKTFEDSKIKTKEERLMYYGQKDHVRLYGYDYKERLENYGLKVEVHSPQNELTLVEIEKYGFIADDVQIIAEL